MPPGDAERAAKLTARRLLTDAAEIEGDEERKAAVRWALGSQSESRIRACLTLAATELEIALAADQLDRDPWLLCCANGTVDLRSGELREHDPSNLITLATDVAYTTEADCPRWQRFLSEVFGGDIELIDFMQRFIGYALTGDTREHVLVVLQGSGCNGKSTLLGVLKRLLGDYAVTAPFDTFMRTRGDRGPRNDLARLHRARLVTAAESGEGRRLDEATVKEITGGDTIACRFLYAEHFEYVPQFKLALVTNHRPRVDGDDDAIWRRLRLVPFERSFEGHEDRQLPEKLDAELPGILAWALEGCLAWQKHGLGQAGAVTRATTEYRQDEDVLGSFLAERCVMTGETATSAFREAYAEYCGAIGEKPLSAAALGRRLAKRGIRRTELRRGDYAYSGVSLR
jgi:putative DNA primase/helicase